MLEKINFLLIGLVSLHFAPNQMGVHTINDFSAKDISSYIDWTPFFQTWELHGRYPKILDDEIVGEEAKKLF